MASGNVPFVGRLKAAAESWVDALRMWLTHLPCEDTKHYVGNFLSVYRVRPSGAEDANSDDSGIDEPLLVTATTLPTALQTSFRKTGQHRATRTTDQPKDVDTKLLASYEDAAARAATTWQHNSYCAANETTRNPFEAHDPKAIRRGLKALERKCNNTNAKTVHNSLPGVCEIEARATAQKVDQFRHDLSQTKQCNPEQLCFIETVCARIKHEAATGQDRGGAAETNTEALRWALHGGPGTGKSYVLNILRRDLFEKCLGWTPGKEFQVVVYILFT